MRKKCPLFLPNCLWCLLVRSVFWSFEIAALGRLWKEKNRIRSIRNQSTGLGKFRHDHHNHLRGCKRQREKSTHLVCSYVPISIFPLTERLIASGFLSSSLFHSVIMTLMNSPITWRIAWECYSSIKTDEIKFHWKIWNSHNILGTMCMVKKVLRQCTWP